MYNRVFTWVETRVFLNVKNLAFTLYCGVYVLVVVVVGGGGGGGGSRRYNHTNIYHDPAVGYSFTCVDLCWRVRQWAVVRNAFHSHSPCWYMPALNNNGNEHRC